MCCCSRFSRPCKQSAGDRGWASSDHEAGGGGSGVKPSLRTRRTRSVKRKKKRLHQIILLWYALSVTFCWRCVCLCPRPASDPDRCHQGGETVCESGHRRRWDTPRSADRLLAAVVAQGLNIYIVIVFYFLPLLCSVFYFFLHTNLLICCLQADVFIFAGLSCFYTWARYLG